MLVEPLKLTPPMVLAVVSVAALPVVFWLPVVLTPGKLMLAEPLKLTPPMVLAVVSVAALPVVFWLSVGTSLATIVLKVGTPFDALGAARNVFVVWLAKSLAATASVPPSVKLPVVVTVPVSVNPLTVPVPPTLVTVPVFVVNPAFAVTLVTLPNVSTVIALIPPDCAAAVTIPLVNATLLAFTVIPAPAPTFRLPDVYVNPLPPTILASIAVLALAVVKYWFVPSATSVVLSVLVPPSATDVPLMVILLLAKLLLGILLKLNTPVVLL
jgi:hypothetical protein